MMKPSLQLRIGQQLTMTPQLQQAIRLLQLPITELQAQLQEALESNVMLDQVEERAEEVAPEPSVQDAAPETAAEAPDTVDVVAGTEREESWSDPAFSGSGESNWQGDDRQQDYADLSGTTLREHLMWQLKMESLTGEEFLVGQAIIDSVNDNGYLTDTLENLTANLNVDIDMDRVEAIMRLVQTFDPLGVCARDLNECLLLQLAAFDSDTPGLELACTIVRDELELLGSQQFSVLRRRLRTTEEALDQAVALVRALQPHPGAAIAPPSNEYIVPDVFVRKHGGRWLVDVNPGAIPKVAVNQAYANVLGRGSDHTVLRAQLQEARWLVRSLEIRSDTLLRVATSIVERQRDFLEQGDVAMKPMVLRDVAEELGMHESTISRVTTSKYMHTPRGIFEFRHFFSSQVGQEGAEHSSTAIRAMIRKMIAQENPKKPLSDNKIAQMLTEDGIQVARRTVAKYREALTIPSSSERKRMAPR